MKHHQWSVRCFSGNVFLYRFECKHKLILRYITAYILRLSTGDEQVPWIVIGEMFHQLISFYWKLTLIWFPGEAVRCEWTSILSDCVSRPGTSKVQEDLFRNAPPHAKCRWEYGSVSACTEDVCVCVPLRAWVWVYLALSLSGSVRVLGVVKRFRQTSASCGPHRPLTMWRRGSWVSSCAVLQS